LVFGVNPEYNVDPPSGPEIVCITLPGKSITLNELIIAPPLKSGGETNTVAWVAVYVMVEIIGLIGARGFILIAARLGLIPGNTLNYPIGHVT